MRKCRKVRIVSRFAAASRPWKSSRLHTDRLLFLSPPPFQPESTCAATTTATAPSSACPRRPPAGRACARRDTASSQDSSPVWVRLSRPHSHTREAGWHQGIRAAALTSCPLLSPSRDGLLPALLHPRGNQRNPTRPRRQIRRPGAGVWHLAGCRH